MDNSIYKNKTYKKVLLIAKCIDIDFIRPKLVALLEFLHSKELQIFLDFHTAEQYNLPNYPSLNAEKLVEHEVDLAIVLGGDGTMLRYAKHLAIANVPLIGINQGHMGFLTDISAGAMQEELSEILLGDSSSAQRFFLQMTIERQGKAIYQGMALNDVVIHKMALLRLIELEVAIDSNFMHSQRSDGLIIATPTGATAYALSAGGPILMPNLEAIVLVPICPHTLTNRPIVVSDQSHILVSVVQTEDVGVYLDGQFTLSIRLGDTVFVKRSPLSLQLLHPLKYSHFSMLREKLNWR